MVWADWVQELLDRESAPDRWSPARQRAEAEWRNIWCPPNHIKVGTHFVSVEIKRRPKWRHEGAAAA